MGRNAVRIVRPLGIVLAAAALLTPLAADAAKKAAKPAKVNYNRVYTATNNPAGNAVIVFTRAADGKLTQIATVPTGGKGIASEPPFGFPIVDTSGSINLRPDGKLLFVVNAGSNTVTSFRVTSSGLQRVSVAPTQGKLPMSLTSSGHLLYVVNEISKNIYGWTFTPSGVLHPIAGSNRPLTAVTPAGKKDKVGVAAGIGFTSDGGVVAVTQRGLPRQYGEIDTFVIARNGAAGPSHAFATNGVPNPFGFSATGKYLLVSNAGFVATPSGTPPNPGDFTQFTGSAATYKVSPTGKVTFVANTLTGGRAACWLIVTKDGKTAIVTNTLSKAPPTSGKGAVSSLSVGANGKMTLLQQADTGPGFPSDEGFSHDDKYLYVIDPTVVIPPSMIPGSHIEVYRLGPGGSMTNIQSTPTTLPNTISGIGSF
jgi:6-phosphogluconolactonase